MINENKEIIRRRLLSGRNRSPEKDLIIFEKLINLKEFKNSSKILTYVSKKDEIDTIRLIEHSLGSEKNIYVPKICGCEIVFYEIGGLSDLEAGNFGVYEPKEYCKELNPLLYPESLCITPALACNADNHRIGYGKGYYDRFLKNYAGFSIALCYRENIIGFDNDINDIGVNLIISA